MKQRGEEGIGEEWREILKMSGNVGGNVLCISV